MLQDYEQCREYLSSITDTIQHRLSSYLHHLQYLIQRHSCDRLSVISADVILLSYEHFPVNCDQVCGYYFLLCIRLTECVSYIHTCRGKFLRGGLFFQHLQFLFNYRFSTLWSGEFHGKQCFSRIYFPDGGANLRHGQ